MLSSTCHTWAIQKTLSVPILSHHSSLLFHGFFFQILCVILISQNIYSCSWYPLSLQCMLGCTHPEYLSKVVTQKTTSPLQQKCSKPISQAERHILSTDPRIQGSHCFTLEQARKLPSHREKPLMSLGFRGRVQMKAGGRADFARQGKLFLSLMMKIFCRNKTSSCSCYQKDNGADWQDRTQGSSKQ